MDEDYEKHSIHYLARKAWDRYNPEWLLDAVDEASKNDDETPFELSAVREAFQAGFKAAYVHKLTGEIPKEGRSSIYGQS